MQRLLRTLCLIGSSVLFFSSYGLPGNWQIQGIDEWYFCSFASLALDSLDRPYVAYFREEPMIDTDLILASWNGSQWQYEVVEANGLPWYPSLQLDSLDRPHIAYYKARGANSGLKYASWDGATWHIELVDRNCNHGPSLVLDNWDHPHISYPGNDVLWYATKDSAGWHRSMADWRSSPGHLGVTNCIALDTLQQPHIVYSTDWPPHELRHCFWDGLQWEIDTVDPGWINFYTSLTIDSLNRLHVSYEADGALKYATDSMDTWQLTVVDTSGYVRGGTSINTDRRNLPAIAYYGGDGSWQDLRFAFWDGSSWHTEVVDSAIYHPFWHGGVVSLKFNSLNQPCIAYQGGAVVKYAVGDSISTGTEERKLAPTPEPIAVRLHQNCPNPFAVRTAVNYAIPEESRVSLAIYDLAGARVKVLVDQKQIRGRYTVSWNGRNDMRNKVKPGIYFCCLRVGDRYQSRKMVLLR